MLAYVFWHWPAASVERSSYERMLTEFHRALAARPPTGFRGSTSLRIEAVPWLGTAVAGYEDWYLLDGSAALDPLDEAAVSGTRKAPHDRVARVAAGGTAGLYRLRAGVPALARGRVASWFAKPAGEQYVELYARLRGWSEQPDTGLWERQMTLGPAPEFCLRGPLAPELPADLAPWAVPLEPIWP